MSRNELFAIIKLVGLNRHMAVRKKLGKDLLERRCRKEAPNLQSPELLKPGVPPVRERGCSLPKYTTYSYGL